MTRHLLFLLGLIISLARPGGAAIPARFDLVGNWEIEVTIASPVARKTSTRVEPPKLITVAAERYSSLPLFNPHAGGWVKGAQLQGVKAQETTTPHLLDAESFVLRAGPDADAAAFQHGKDFEIDTVWGTFGRLTNGLIGATQTVYASYRHAQLRLDAIVLTANGQIMLRQGHARAAAPNWPKIEAGEVHLGNVWLPGNIARLSSDHLFPILEPSYPETARQYGSSAERCFPKALKKLQSGDRLRILAWGDSVTVGTYLPEWQRNRWQEQFTTRLRERFPRANIELMTEAWGGRNTGSYLSEPPGSPHNYQEKVLGSKPDLIVSEFVNDAGMNPKEVESRYGKLLADFQGIGAEWIILTPHYVRPDWMGLNREREIDDDPRPYVAGLRQFAAKNSVAIADASRRYGRLWRQGIPYSTLMLNSINHPDARGMGIFSDALMEIFP